MSQPTSPRGHDDEPKSFMPKNPVQLDAPKDDAITYEELSKCDGKNPDKPTLVAIKGTVFDVSRNSAYAPGGSYSGRSSHFPSPCLPPRLSMPPASPAPSYLLPTLAYARLVFAGKDPSRALAQSSLKPADCVPEWEDLEDQHKTVLNEWFTFFSKRYNIVGKVRANSGETKL